MSNEIMKVFPQTITAMHKRELNLEAILQENTKGLSTMAKDGDMIDDSYMLMLHSERENIESQLQQLRTYLNSEIISNNIPNDHPIDIGYQVEIKIKYPDGSKEDILVTIGSALDSQYLEQENGFLTDNSILISNNSSLGKSLLDKRVGEDIEYKSPMGVNKAKIITAKLSPLLIK
jgi:transcription elongation GreA/GreB family factor